MTVNEVTFRLLCLTKSFIFNEKSIDIFHAKTGISTWKISNTHPVIYLNSLTKVSAQKKRKENSDSLY